MSAKSQPSRRRRTTSIERMEVGEAGGILGVGQKALRQAEALVARGTRSKLRPATRAAVVRACEAADDAQRAINAEMEASR